MALDTAKAPFFPKALSTCIHTRGQHQSPKSERYRSDTTYIPSVPRSRRAQSSRSRARHLGRTQPAQLRNGRRNVQTCTRPSRDTTDLMFEVNPTVVAAARRLFTGDPDRVDEHKTTVSPPRRVHGLSKQAGKRGHTAKSHPAHQVVTLHISERGTAFTETWPEVRQHPRKLDLWDLVEGLYSTPPSLKRGMTARLDVLRGVTKRLHRTATREVTKSSAT